MTIDPDALLIFRVRGSATEEEKAKKESKQQQNVEHAKALPMLGRFKPEKNTEPAVASRAGKPIAEMAAPKKPAQRAAPAQPKQETAKQPQQPNELAPKAKKAALKPDVNVIGMGIFSERVKSSAEEGLIIPGTASKSVYGKEAPGEQGAAGTSADKQHASKKGTTAQRGRLSREAAKGHTCVWHTWRQAYAVCAYCHRPFCYQDTIEFNKEYYCLQDIDNISSKYKETVESSGTAVSVIAGILLMVSFLIFIYFANGQLIYILEYVSKVSLPYFTAHMNYSYALALLSGLLVLIGLADAIMIFVQARSSFIVGIILCLISVVVFSYQFTSTGTAYLGIVAAIMFMSFIGLLYSETAAGAIKEPQTSIGQKETQAGLIRWPNAGRF
ncbi:MAG: hypothetical protein ACREBH_02890 [Candidatus Micrarchaeaceae archaeon]